MPSETVWTCDSKCLGMSQGQFKVLSSWAWLFPLMLPPSPTLHECNVGDGSQNDPDH